MSYQPKVYKEQGGAKLVVASGGELDLKTGSKVLTNGTQASAIASAPAGGTGATEGAYDTAGNRDAMIASLNAILAALRAAGIIAT